MGRIYIHRKDIKNPDVVSCGIRIFLWKTENLCPFQTESLNFNCRFQPGKRLIQGNVFLKILDAPATNMFAPAFDMAAAFSKLTLPSASVSTSAYPFISSHFFTCSIFLTVEGISLRPAKPGSTVMIRIGSISSMILFIPLDL